MKLLKFWKPGIWLLIICYLSLMPGEELPPVRLFNIPHADKIVHMGFYFILSIFLIKPFSGLGSFPYILTFITSATISGAIEIMQEKLAVSRHGDLYDFLANISGILIALVFYHYAISGKKHERFF